MTDPAQDNILNQAGHTPNVFPHRTLCSVATTCILYVLGRCCSIPSPFRRCARKWNSASVLLAWPPGSCVLASVSAESAGSASSPGAAHQRERADAQQQGRAVDEAAAGKTLGHKEAFWLATMGGAYALGLQVCLSCHKVCRARQPTRSILLYRGC